MQNIKIFYQILIKMNFTALGIGMKVRMDARRIDAKNRSRE